MKKNEKLTLLISRFVANGINTPKAQEMAERIYNQTNAAAELA